MDHEARSSGEMCVFCLRPPRRLFHDEVVASKSLTPGSGPEPTAAIHHPEAVEQYIYASDVRNDEVVQL